MTRRTDPWNIVRLLAFTQIVSWGSLFYAFAIVAHDLQHEFGWRTELVFGAYSWSLLISGLAATPIGVLLDRFGGRAVMGIGSLLAAIGLLLLATTHSVLQYFVAWSVLGIAMAMTLYEAAFATINREFLHDARQGISVLSLFGGLASTVFWPLTLKLNGAFGWRNTFLIYAAVHVAVCLPLHALLSARRREAQFSAAAPADNVAHPETAAATVAANAGPAGRRDFTLHEAVRDPTFWKLAFAFSANIFVFAALAVHLIPLLQRFGHSAGMAVLVSTLVGPMQVAGRIGEMTIGRRIAPQTIGKLVFALLPAALLIVMGFGTFPVAVALFCLLYGISNGILTIVRGTIPRTLFGRENYGAIAGAMAGPSLVAKAAGPLIAAPFVEANSSPYWLLGMLFVVSVLSLGCYLAAVKSRRGDAMFDAVPDADGRK